MPAKLKTKETILMRVVTPNEMNKTDKLMAEKYSMPTLLLMENAGLAIATYLSKSYGKNTRMLFIAGSGNNGGDGWAAARMLHTKGYNVKAVSLATENRMRELVLANYNLARVLGVPHALEPNAAELLLEMQKADVIIDAILGTGITGVVNDATKFVINAVNASGKDVISVDVPSGINALTGEIMGAAVNADAVIVLGTLKQGLLFAPAKHCYKKLIIDEISIPEHIYDETSEPKFNYTREEIGSMLRFRSPDSHKGTYGKLGIIAGSTGMTGAACLSAESAVRAGAGIIQLAVPQSLNPIFEVKLTEQMTVPVPDNEQGALIVSKELYDFVDGKSALLIGPGLSLNSEGGEFIPQILNIYNSAVVIDADGINSINKNPDALKRGNCIITPHIGEMARLTGKTPKEVADNQTECALQFAREYNVTVVLKNYITVIASPDGRIAFNTTGNSGMATGGSGDVLSGIIASLCSQGYDNFTAAVIGTYVNGLAADIAAERTGEISLTPSDTVDALAEAFKRLS